MNEVAYRTGLLKPEVHYRLVENLPSVLRDAGLSPEHRASVWTRLKDVCGKREGKWVRNLHNNVEEGVAGLVYHGAFGVPTVETRMIAITGCLLRNFVDARLVTLRGALEEDAAPTVLLIPNFSAEIKMYDREVGVIADLLFERWMHGRQTVLHASSPKFVAERYGRDVANLIADHYRGVQEGQ